MPLPKELRESLARRHDEETRLADRDRLRANLLSALACLGWSAAGILCILWSVHTDSVTYGKVAMYGGIAIGDGGIIFTLLRAWNRSEERGDS